jgi:UDP-N-acetylglucosamine--N-acetylmuramyl-(pentapeptide) pyrophosphoryl-undecaprenol N-acetylglucosamine transferase
LKAVPSIVLAGGGTAGHTSPLIATADALRRIDPTIEILALGTERGLETRVVPAAGYRLELIPPVPLPRRPTPALLDVPGRMLASVAAARSALDDARPTYWSASAGTCPPRPTRGVAPQDADRGARGQCRAGDREQVRGALLHRARGGLVPRHPAAARVVRRAADPPGDLDPGPGRVPCRGRAFFGLDPHAPTLLVTGGSQGAQRLNEAFAGAAAELQAAGIQVLHVIGPKNTLDAPAAGTRPYVVLPYVDRMDLAYAAADLVICRAGANTVTEVSGVGLPAVYVPLPHGNGEQELNARGVVDAGGGPAGRQRRGDGRVGPEHGDRPGAGRRPPGGHVRGGAGRDPHGRRRPVGSVILGIARSGVR